MRRDLQAGRRSLMATAPAAASRSLLWRLVAFVPTLLVLMLLGWAALFLLIAPELPDTDTLFADSEQRTVTLLAADGGPLAERGAEGARFVGLPEIAPHLVQAVLAIEDHRFYGHFGIDPLGLARAAWANLLAGEVVAGGSTITQQLAKNLFLTPERSLKRKLQELALALWLEARLSKDEILTLYLNRVYLGAGAYGVEAAARRYFGKSAKEVTLAEAAMLAGLLKAPSAMAPTRDLERARARAEIVLKRMVELGMVPAERAAAARARPAAPAPETKTDFAGHFLDWVLDDLTDHLGKHGRDLVVRSTLDRKLQLAAEQALRSALAGEGAKRGVSEGAVVALDASGAVRAMVGGESYRASRFNRAASARRQPGSAFKPFLYLAALRAGWTPQSPIDDRPIAIGDWRPENFDGRYRGRVSLEDAFAHSLNAAAARLIQSVGPEAVVRTARELGIASPLPPVPSLALGTAEVSPLELAAAYLPFVTGGVRRSVHAVRNVEDDRKRVLYRYVPSERRVMDGREVQTMRTLMAAVVERGTGRAARLADRVVMGKTGTSQGFRDAWFVGFAGDLLVAVWLGNDDGRPMEGVTGGGLPARIARQVLEAAPPSPPAGPEVARGEPPPAARSVEREENGLAILLDWVQRTFGSR
ncbi:MAG: PBP1A family penicillin-binding protein [Geminicoccaceae bacterium]|nr:PBP1A family penicillin-binding protein [Geminicoccaceae bacterium]MDW8369134.1 PBP1A family penicillin-binding protein [Geminicoccaceae bacterium]